MRPSAGDDLCSHLLLGCVFAFGRRERNYDISVLRENASTVSQEAVQQVRARRQAIGGSGQTHSSWLPSEMVWLERTNRGRTLSSILDIYAPSLSCLCNDDNVGVRGWFQHSEATAAALQEASKNQIALLASLAQQKSLAHELTLQTDAIRQQLKHERVSVPSYIPSAPPLPSSHPSALTQHSRVFAAGR